MTPLPLRTVRPFVIEEIVLTEVAEAEGLDITDQMEISKYLKGKVFILSYADSSEMTQETCRSTI